MVHECIDCGNEFESDGTMALRCKKCGRNWLRYKSLIRSKKHSHLTYDAYKRSIGVEIKTKEKSRENPNEEVDINRCYFCGRRISENQFFCSHCRKEGFDDVYITTGKTNGWDAKPRKKVDIPDGWRGRKITGNCTAHSQIPFEQ